MKVKFLIGMSAMLFAGIAFFAACEKEETSKTGDLFELDIEGDTLFIGGEAGSEVFLTLDSDFNWEVTEKPDWLLVDPEDGYDGISDITITAEQLDSKEGIAERFGELTFKSATSDHYRTLTVKQSYDFPKNVSCKVDPTSISASIAKTSAMFKITCNAPWTATAENDWITLDKPNGGSGTITVRAEMAASANERNGSIKVKSGNKVITIPVSQKVTALDAILTAKTITAPGSDANGNASRRTKKFYLKSNYAWDITTENTWITIDPSSGTGTGTHVTITATIEPGAEDVGEITVKVHTLKSEDGELKPFDEVRTIPVYRVDDAPANYWHDGEQIILHSPYNIPSGRNPIPVALVMDGFDLGDLRKCPNSPTPSFSGKFVTNYAEINSYSDWGLDASDDCVYERFVRAISDLLLRLPVLRDFENYFDLRAYVAESNSRGKYDFTPFGWSWQHGGDEGKMRDKAYNMYGSDYPGISQNVDGAASNVTYFFGHNAGVGGFNIGDACIISNPMVQAPYFYHLGHEYGGHTLGRIPDLYYNCSYTVDDKNVDRFKNITMVKTGVNPGTYTTNDKGQEEDIWSGRVDGGFYPCYQNQSADGNYNDCDVRNIVQGFASEWKRGSNWNVDYEKDPAKVMWADFINDSDYIKDNGVHVIGVYPTAFNGMFCGFYGPEDIDCMKNSNEAHYNLGTRMWLWSKILQRAGVPAPITPFGDWNDFSERSINAFKDFDTAPRVDPNGEITESFDHGYARHPRYVFKEDSILMQKYWVDHDIYPERKNRDGGGF
ncbi:MAG: BACON domain-containing protein [Prevotellaceae bacterium]|jgi:hypothetical protein|nr:BACON domain-containing protein [Prevotellaceae bacterium]